MLAIGRHVSKLSGYAPALPTPFREDGMIDFAAFEALCELQIGEGASALVVCGTTGEAPTLSILEQRELVAVAVRIAAGRIPVIAGAGSNATARAIELTRNAEAAGADAVLSVVPYYNKPTQVGLMAHFNAIATSTGLPIILYDVPARTVVGLTDETVIRLAESPQIIGLKDAAGDVGRPARLRRRVGSDFRILSGDDVTAPAFLAFGGCGVISVTSNVVPSMCRSMFLACQQGQTARANRLASAVADLTAILFRETNPVPLKHALSVLGLMSPTVRLPLVAASEPAQRDIAAVIARFSAEHAEHIIGDGSERHRAGAARSRSVTQG